MDHYRAGTRVFLEVDLSDPTTGLPVSPAPDTVKITVLDGAGAAVATAVTMNADTPGSKYTYVLQLADNAYPGIYAWWADIAFSLSKDRTLKMDGFVVEAL